MSRRKILVVDDNVDAADAVAVLLETDGHEVRTAYTGRDAIRDAVAWEPDAMILDIGLPDMTGHDLARHIRALCLRSQPLLVALSGYGRPSDLKQSREAGFAHHVVKPADPATLFALFSQPAFN